uniref:Uncharacterized protein n=1 Tax=Anguilla anguilla TaxID=7936 RepID=A0A0E9WJJ8_ANGAN
MEKEPNAGVSSMDLPENVNQESSQHRAREEGNGLPTCSTQICDNSAEPRISPLKRKHERDDDDDDEDTSPVKKLVCSLVVCF